MYSGDKGLERLYLSFRIKSLNQKGIELGDCELARANDVREI